ncbi:MAG: glycosyltransferase [Candidatus Eisenbacteria bacterium]
MSAAAGRTARAGCSVLVYLPYATQRLGEIVETIHEAMREEEYEVLLLDDGTGRGAEWSAEYGNGPAPLKVLRFARRFGEAIALDAALPHARGGILLTIPAGTPVTAAEMRALLAEIRAGADLVVGCRSGRAGSLLERIPLSVYRWLARRATGVSFRDFTSRVRALRREVAEETAIYGEMIRFLPILAVGRGYRVAQMEIEGKWPQQTGRGRVGFEPMVWVNRMLDVLTLYFLLRFTKRPLRFFGILGIVLLLPGLLITLYLFVVRVFAQQGIAGRPLLLLGILLMVLGVQTISIGLIGEMIIFTHSRESRDYSVLEVLE